MYATDQIRRIWIVYISSSPEMYSEFNFIHKLKFYYI